jgi:hypothetical protein
MTIASARSFDTLVGTSSSKALATSRRARCPVAASSTFFGSGEHFEYRPRFSNEPAQSPKLSKGFACVVAMFQRIFIATRSARAWRATMHATPRFAPHGRGHAWFAGTRFGPTAPARQHRACVTRMIAGHFFADAGQALAPAAPCLALPVAARRSELAFPRALPVHSG